MDAPAAVSAARPAPGKICVISTLYYIVISVFFI